MTDPHRLDIKIRALNAIDRNDGDVNSVSDSMQIPTAALQTWLNQENELRRRYQARRARQAQRLAEDLQLAMLERAQAILGRMDDALSKAPLNQLATALSALVGSALKLEGAMDESDAQEEKIIRFEHFYDGSLHEAPPWAGASEGFDRSLQGSGVREALGQDRIGQADHPGGGAGAETLLVAGADEIDGEPGLA